MTMMRFDSTEMGASKSEIVAYGTARVVEWLPDQTKSIPEGRAHSMSVAVWVFIVGSLSRRPWSRGGCVRLGSLSKQRKRRQRVLSTDRARSSPTPRRASRCASGTTHRPANGNTVKSKKWSERDAASNGITVAWASVQECPLSRSAPRRARKVIPPGIAVAVGLRMLRCSPPSCRDCWSSIVNSHE